jgi:hypothetical protein
LDDELGEEESTDDEEDDETVGMTEVMAIDIGLRMLS